MPLAHALARVVQPQRRRRSERESRGRVVAVERRGAPLMADLRGLKFEILEFFLSVAILYFFHDCFPLCAN